MEMVRDEAERVGWPADAIHRETFAPDAAALATPKDEIEVPSQSAAELLAPADRSIRRVLSEHGIHVACSREQGVCGAGQTAVVHGEVGHRDTVLSDAERAAATRGSSSSPAPRPFPGAGPLKCLRPPRGRRPFAERFSL